MDKRPFLPHILTNNAEGSMNNVILTGSAIEGGNPTERHVMLCLAKSKLGNT